MDTEDGRTDIFATGHHDYNQGFEIRANFPAHDQISQYKGVLEFSYPLLVLLIDAFYIAILRQRFSYHLNCAAQRSLYRLGLAV